MLDVCYTKVRCFSGLESKDSASFWAKFMPYFLWTQTETLAYLKFSLENPLMSDKSYTMVIQKLDVCYTFVRYGWTGLERRNTTVPTLFRMKPAWESRMIPFVYSHFSWISFEWEDAPPALLKFFWAKIFLLRLFRIQAAMLSPPMPLLNEILVNKKGCMKLSASYIPCSIFLLLLRHLLIRSLCSHSPFSGVINRNTEWCSDIQRCAFSKLHSWQLSYFQRQTPANRILYCFYHDFHMLSSGFSPVFFPIEPLLEIECVLLGKKEGLGERCIAPGILVILHRLIHCPPLSYDIA